MRSAREPLIKEDEEAGSWGETCCGCCPDAACEKPGLLTKLSRCHVTIEGLRYSVSAAPILHGVDLVLRPGELTAVMGASGAGKSTLLELAAGRREAGTTTGRVMYNGVPLSAALRHCIAFVHQHDVALATLTVRETLRYAAALRMPHAAA